MTPAIDYCHAHGIEITIHRYEHDPRQASYGLEAAEKLGIAPDKVFKTLVVSDGKNLSVALLPVAKTLHLKKLAKQIGVKKLSLADPQTVQNKTGYVLGGVSPIAQKQPLPTWIDDSLSAHAYVFVSAGQRGLEIEIAQADLIALTQATLAPIS